METLEQRYKNDPKLLAFYQKKLLIRGWAGRTDDVEKEYVRRMNPDWYAHAVLVGIQRQKS